jgi:hypothetical protein
VRRETPAQEADALSGLSAEERTALLALLDRALASTEAALERNDAAQDRSVRA